MRPVTDLQRKVAPFEVVTDMVPAGDQPTAIAEIEKRVNAGEPDTVLLGATGTGKTATVAWLAERLDRPVLVMLPNKTHRRPVRQRAARDDAQQRGRVLRLLLRLLPARGVHPADRHLHREGLLDQRRGRAAAPLGDQLAADPARHDRGGLGLLHLRSRHPPGVPRPDAAAACRRPDGPRGAAAAPGRHAVLPQRPRLHPRHVPGPGRHDRDHPAVRGARGPDRDVRRRGRAAVHPAPADRRGDHRGPGALRLPRHPLRGGRGADGARHRQHRGRAGGAAGRARAGGQAPRGAAAADADHLRPRDDAPGRQLRRHRELLAAHRRPRGGQRAEHAA